jgi:hypothetical protein
MIVAVESNFVLQLALKQEESAAAQEVLDLAVAHQIQLAIPACALFEPYGTLFRRHRDRRYGCKVIPRFDDAVGFIQSQLGPQPPPVGPNQPG